MEQNHIPPAAPQPEIIDITTSTTPEPEIFQLTTLKRDKSKFDIWSLPPAPGSANALPDVKQNQASVSSGQAPVAKKKKKEKKKKQTATVNQPKVAKLKNHTIRISEKHVGKVLRLIYNPGSSLVDIEFYFKCHASSWDGPILGSPGGEAIVKRLDTGDTEKKAFDRLSQMAGDDTIEPILQWGFVGQHLRVEREKRGQLNVTERFTVRVECTKKRELPLENVNPLGLEQTESECRAALGASVRPQPGVILPDEIGPMTPSSYQHLISHLPASQLLPIHTSTEALVCLTEQDKVAKPSELYPSVEHDSLSASCEDVAMLESQPQVAEQLERGDEESTNGIEVDLRLRMADDELQASSKAFLELELQRLNLTRNGLPTQGSSESLAYRRLLENMKRNIERSQEAIEVAQSHAERVYQAREREGRIALEMEQAEEVARSCAGRVQQVRERDSQLALEQADTFLQGLGDIWERGNISLGHV